LRSGLSLDLGERREEGGRFEVLMVGGERFSIKHEREREVSFNYVVNYKWRT